MTCQEQFDIFNLTINSLLDTHLPLKEITKFATDKPWVTDSFKDLIAQRQSARNSKQETRFNFLRNKVNRLSKRLRSNYYENKIEKLKSTKPGDWWKGTNALIGRNSSKGGELEGLAADLFHGDMKQLSTAINDFFHSVSSHLEPLKPWTNNDIHDIPSRYIIPEEKVAKKLMSTKITKAPGPDGVPNWILHDLAGLISHPVCAIFNSSIREGYLPLIWKSANVVPVPKVHPPRSIESDLRPISLTPILAKQLESFVGEWLLEEIGEKLDLEQFGATKGLSTTDALIDITHHWHIAIHDRDDVRVLLLDYSKAFDLVDHNILVEKFASLGIHEILLRWLHAFLSDRQQRVKLGQDVSDWLSMQAAMPQGSYLGPLSFVVFIKDMPHPETIKSVKYVDDTTLSERVNNRSPSQLQDTADMIIDWSNDNKMKINEKKTKEMYISTKHTPVPPTPLVMNGQGIERIKVFKLLGVWFQDDLSWDQHVSHMLSRAATRLYYLRQLRRAGLGTDDLLGYYKAVVRSVVEYASQVWNSGLTRGQSEDLERVQKRALHVIFPDTDYDLARELSELQTLEGRREQLDRVKFEKLKDPSHRLNCLLPQKRVYSHDVRAKLEYPLPRCHNNRFRKDCIVNMLYKQQGF